MAHDCGVVLGSAQYLPAGHGEQYDALVPLYVPAEHGEHVDSPRALYVPAKQSVGDV